MAEVIVREFFFKAETEIEEVKEKREERER